MLLNKRQKQRIWLIIAFVIVTFFASKYDPENVTSSATNQSLQQLIDNRRSDTQIAVTAQIFKTLPDDLKGSRHQRFLIKLASGDTVLIAHNIDLAPKINNLKQGDMVTIFGEYEWNEKGGVIHWTHHDPKKRHVDGWIEHNGRQYQ